MRRVFLVFVTGCVASGLAAVGLDSLTRATLEQGLATQGITPPELGFFKQWATDSFFRLKIVDRMLDNPLEVASYTDLAAKQVQLCQGSPASLLLYQYRQIDVDIGQKDSARVHREILAETRGVRAEVEASELAALPSAVGQAVSVVLAGFRVGSRYLTKATAGLTEKELDRLVGEAPNFWHDEDDTLEKSWAGMLHREFGLDYDTTGVRAETVLTYARKLDRRSLALAGLAVTLGACEAFRLLESSSVALAQNVELRPLEGIEGGVYASWQTAFGLVVVGANHDNIYRRDCCLAIDLGGDDSYFNRAGGAVGVLDHPFSVLVDCEGNDRYDCSRAFSQGSAVFGAGVLIDAAGNDVYRAGNYSQGTGVFGTGFLWDIAGRDIYDAGCCVQGAGHFGCGLLLEAEDNDAYRSLGYCQGFSSTWGYGLCADFDGNDCYYAGGRYRHEPLLPHEYRSFGQGFSIGWRPDAAGGIGFLYDKSGNDFYDAEVYAQGTSYWYSLGMLWDGDGYDHYTAAQYSQGSGIHLAIGSLVDNEGNDSYYSRLGPSQGEGHDLSVGLLLDRKGNDVYFASGGAGVALTNSVGLFCDMTGNDVYSSTEPVALGGGTAARGFASSGNFMDLAGHDRYTAGSAGSDTGYWTNGTYGSGSDLSAEPVPGDEADEGDTLETIGDSIALPIDSIFRIAATWEVGNARARVRQARRQLHALGRRAVEYVCEKKLDTKDGLESRAIEELFKAWPDTALPYMMRALRDERYLARNNAAYWLGKMGKDAMPAVESLLLALREGRITPRRAVNALGDIGDSLVVPRIVYLLGDTFELSRIVTAEACGKLKNPAAIPGLIRSLGDRLFTVRSAAEMALVAIGEPVQDTLLSGLDRLKPPALGHALRAVAEIAAKLDSTKAASADSTRQRLVSYLGHRDAFVRLVTVQGLAKLGTEPVRESLSAARAVETNRFVLAALRKALVPD
ncbi:MAG: HEAT repeat domain-containing protein [candidate division WOR-3 bacterium]